jgi:aspartyl protease family protein
MKQLLFYSLITIATVSLFSCNNGRRRDDHSLVNRSRTENTSHQRGKSVVKMRKEHNVYYIPCKINGMEMEFIFDTGAADISMSLTEAKFMYKQGKLTDDDFTGTQHYQIADGSIHEGLTVMLRKVEIGNRELHNVEASIDDNENAPLLLGQSALAKFGKISIDYKRNELTFE